MKRRNNILYRISSLKTFTKIFLVLLYFVFSISCVFFKCNIYNIKNRVNGKVDVYSDVVMKEKDDSKIYVFDFDKSAVKKIFIKYSTEKSFNLQFDYYTDDSNTQFDYSNTDECSKYSSINVYDINDTLDSISVEVPHYVSIEDIYINNDYSFDYSLFSLFVISFIIFVTLLYVYNKGFEKIYVLFAVMYISFGTFMVIAMPPVTGSSWDDQIHFRNVVQTIQLGDYQKTDAEDVVIHLQSGFHNYNQIEEQNDYISTIDRLDKNISIEKNNKNIISYYSLAYLPGSIIYNILKTVGVSFSLRFNLVRIASIVMDAIIIAYAIKIIKKYKLLLFSVALIPEGLFIASNYNYDTFIFSFTILAFASFVNMINSDKIQSKDVLRFVISITLTTLTKVIYGPLLLLLFLIPNSKFKTEKNGKNVKKLLFLIVFLTMSAFVIPVLFSNVSMNDSRGGGNVNLVLQIKYMFHNPISSSLLIIKHVINNFFGYTISSQVMLFFAYRSGISSELYFILVLIFILSFLQACEEKNDDKMIPRLFIVLLVVAIICATWLILYLTFNNVGSSSIGGVQPRYFMPLILYMFYPLITSKISCKFNKENLLSIVTFLYVIVYICIFMAKYCSYM